MALAAGGLFWTAKNGGVLSSGFFFGVFRRLAAVAAGACLVLVLAGCGSLLGTGGGEDEAGKLRAENEELRAENETLRAEVEDLQGQVAEVSDEGASADVESSESTQSGSESGDSSGGDSGASSGGGSIEVAGDGDVSGSDVPDLMPEDFPLPSGAVLDYTNEGDYNFSLDFVLDSDLESLTTFYEKQLQETGWEEVDRTEYEQDGLEGVETSWEKGTYIPKGSPQDSDYEQTDQTLSLTLQEIQPSGAAGRLLWNSYKLLDESN